MYMSPVCVYIVYFAMYCALIDARTHTHTHTHTHTQRYTHNGEHTHGRTHAHMQKHKNMHGNHNDGRAGTSSRIQGSLRAKVDIARLERATIRIIQSSGMTCGYRMSPQTIVYTQHSKRLQWHTHPSARTRAHAHSQRERMHMHLIPNRSYPDKHSHPWREASQQTHTQASRKPATGCRGQSC